MPKKIVAPWHRRMLPSWFPRFKVTVTNIGDGGIRYVAKHIHVNNTKRLKLTTWDDRVVDLKSSEGLTVIVEEYMDDLD